MVLLFYNYKSISLNTQPQLYVCNLIYVRIMTVIKLYVVPFDLPTQNTNNLHIMKHIHSCNLLGIPSLTMPLVSTILFVNRNNDISVSDTRV